MVYVYPNYKSKKALKDAVAEGKTVTVSSAEPLLVGDASNGTFAAAGPHYPQPHKWYATVTVKDGKVVKVK